MGEHERTWTETDGAAARRLIGVMDERAKQKAAEKAAQITEPGLSLDKKAGDEGGRAGANDNLRSSSVSFKW